MSADNLHGSVIEPTAGQLFGLQPPQPASRSTSDSTTNPFRRSSPKTSPQQQRHDLSSKAPHTSAHARAVSSDSTRPFPPQSSSPRSHHSPSPPATTASGRPRRSSSLRERYPGDVSHRPLETLTRATRVADRAPHLRKKHVQGADSVDRLDDAAALRYHHEGPYDAASLARNNSYGDGVGGGSSPLAALDASNREALRATPRERIRDSVTGHRPLDGVAEMPPGVPDRLGRVYHYREGADLMVEEGNYKRWPGLTYLPEDRKGKGEPSYSIEKALKEHDAASKRHSGFPGDDVDGAELQPLHGRRRSHESALPAAATDGSRQSHGDWEQSRRRSGSGAGARISGEFKRRFGSLRRRDGRAAAVGAGID